MEFKPQLEKEDYINLLKAVPAYDFDKFRYFGAESIANGWVWNEESLNQLTTKQLWGFYISCKKEEKKPPVLPEDFNEK